MDINATLIGEMLTFSILIIVMTKYIWPLLINAINERQEKIISGLDAAKKSKHELEITHNIVNQQLKEAKIQITALMNQAHKQANAIIYQSKLEAIKEKEEILLKTKIQLKQEIISAQNNLKKQIVLLAITIAEKIVKKNINNDIQQQLLSELNSKIGEGIKERK